MIFCSTRCRQATHNRRLRRVPDAAHSRQNNACNTHLSARRPSISICYRVRGKFAFSPAPGARPVLRVRDGIVVWFRLLAHRRIQDSKFKIQNPELKAAA
jgi:hypothetical protein